jgi:DNA-directed RNA polymerase specialized sigma24 family protein
MDKDWTPKLEENVRRYSRAVARANGIHSQHWEDVEQAACYAAWKNFADHSDNPRYLMRCVRNAVVDIARFNARRRIGEELPLFEVGHVDWDAAQTMEAAAEAALLLDSLSDQEQAVVKVLLSGKPPHVVRQELSVSEEEMRDLMASIRRQAANHLCLEWYD